MPKIVLETEIKADIEIVFDLSRSIDLHKISTAHTKEAAVAGKTSGLINMDETVTWKAKHLGFTQYLTTKITEFQFPDYFVDEMVHGAFASFRHEHWFYSKPYGTLMKDVFDYKSPLMILGKLADAIFLKAYMTRLLKKRNATIKEFAESGKWKKILDQRNY